MSKLTLANLQAMQAFNTYSQLLNYKNENNILYLQKSENNTEKNTEICYHKKSECNPSIFYSVTIISTMFHIYF